MELIFEISGGYDAGVNRFAMEVSHSDSVPQIKQKIQQLSGIPIFRQTLRFNGAILADDFTLRHSQIVDGSTIHLHLLQHIAADLQQELNKIARDCGRLQSPPSSDQTPTQPGAAAIHPQDLTPGAGLRIILHQNTHSSSTRSVISPTLRVNIPRQFPTVGSKRAREDIAEGSGIRAEVNAPPGRNRRRRTVYDWIRGRDIGSVRRPRTLIVMVIFCEQRCMVEVRPEEEVRVLRGKLERIEFIHPKPAYLFIHRSRIMDEEQSFEHNQVEQGDFIQPFPTSLFN